MRELLSSVAPRLPGWGWLALLASALVGAGTYGCDRSGDQRGASNAPSATTGGAASSLGSIGADRPLAPSAHANAATSPAHSGSAAVAAKGLAVPSEGRPSDAEQRPFTGLIWEGVSGGVHIRWTGQDIVAKNQTARSWSFSLARDHRAKLQKAMAEAVQDKNPCRWEESVSILSVVGPIVSLERSMYSTCAHAAHPDGETRYVVLDLSALQPGGGAGPALELTKFFGAAPISEALRKDSIVKKALATVSADAPSRPAATSRALPELLKELDGIALDEPCAAFGSDLLTRFAFHHVDKQSVAVRIGVPGSGPCRDALTQLGLMLPTPSGLADALAAAEARREGFLMKDAQAIAKEHRTSLAFGSSDDDIDKARNTAP